MAQQDLIKALSRNKWLSVKELALKSKCTPSSVARGLRSLEKYGEAKRKPSFVYPTKKRNYLWRKT